MGNTVCEWGLEGARKFENHVGAIVVVDVLSFSTCVDVAVAQGAVVYPIANKDRNVASTMAKSIGGEVAGPRGDNGYRYSLSPATLSSIASGTKLVLPSPNGSAISAAISTVRIIAGCLRNARAVAKRIATISPEKPVAVVPAGERWPDGSLRPAIEDLIGAGAIIHELGRPCFPEAEIARQAFLSASASLEELINNCVSGQELIQRGYPQHVSIGIALNASTTAPRLVDGAYIA
jgi:2-phosphosulfolactate phosphatase